MGRISYQSRFSEYIWSIASSEAIDDYLIWKLWVFIIATCIFFVYAGLTNKLKFNRNQLISFSGMILYQIVCIVSTVFSVDYRLSLLGANEQFEPLIVLLLYGISAWLSFQFVRTPEERVWIYRAIAGMVCLMGIVGIVQYAIIQKKVYITLYNANYVGVLMAFLIPILYTKSAKGQNISKEHWFYRISVLMGMIVLVLSGCKSAIAITIWALLLLLLMKRTHAKIYILYLSTTIVLAILVIGILAFSTKERTGVSDVRTEKGEVTFIRNQEALSFQFDMPDTENYIFKLSDMDGNSVSYKKNEEETRYIPTDPRFEEYSFTIVDYDEFYGFMVTVDGRDWYFAKDERNQYQYVNGYVRMDVFQNADNWLFQGQEGFASDRGYIWSRSLPLVLKYLFTGSGPDTFATVFPQNDVGKYLTTDISYNMIITKPHSMYLQIAIQTGILSLFTFIFFVISILRRLWKRMQNSVQGPEKRELESLFVSILCYMMLGFFHDSSLCIAPVFFVLIGVIIARGWDKNTVSL